MEITEKCPICQGTDLEKIKRDLFMIILIRYMIRDMEEVEQHLVPHPKLGC
jgi:hypothetical protein